MLQNGGIKLGNTDCVLACLVQILIDPHYRTISGFVSLIVKDFFIFSGKIPSTREKVWAIFFFFVSCVYELFVQQPSSFEWEEEFFTYIMEVVYRVEFMNGIYIDNFIADINSVQQKVSISSFLLTLYSYFLLFSFFILRSIGLSYFY